jgi:hypothetical protein
LPEKPATNGYKDFRSAGQQSPITTRWSARNVPTPVGETEMGVGLGLTIPHRKSNTTFILGMVTNGENTMKIKFYKNRKFLQYPRDSSRRQVHGVTYALILA